MPPELSITLTIKELLSLFLLGYDSDSLVNHPTIVEKLIAIGNDKLSEAGCYLEYLDRDGVTKLSNPTLWTYDGWINELKRREKVAKRCEELRQQTHLKDEKLKWLYEHLLKRLMVETALELLRFKNYIMVMADIHEILNLSTETYEKMSDEELKKFLEPHFKFTRPEQAELGAEKKTTVKSDAQKAVDKQLKETKKKVDLKSQFNDMMKMIMEAKAKEDAEKAKQQA